MSSVRPTNRQFLEAGGVTDERELAAADRIDQYNLAVREAHQQLGFPHPVGGVQWVHLDRVKCNDYNPNAVAGQEMKLLHISISEDGYTMGVVTIWDDEREQYVIVDGFHRYTTMKRYADIRESTGGYLPIVVIDKPIADRIASTVRHNRARGKHSVNGMGNLVFQMLEQGEDDATICHKLGLEAEELARLKHITGYSKLYANATYSTLTLTKTQMTEKAKYRKEHPDEHIPAW